jgi:hypothetical protein
VGGAAPRGGVGGGGGGAVVAAPPAAKATAAAAAGHEHNSLAHAAVRRHLLSAGKQRCHRAVHASIPTTHVKLPDIG